MLVNWDEHLEIGDPVVDSEHRYLIHLINNLHDQYKSGTLHSKLASVFTHLTKYVHVHFQNEVALMKAINYPELDEHKEAHRKLVDQAIDLSEKFMDDSATITDETIDFLKDWVLKHIADSDMKIKTFLSGERPSTITTTPAFASNEGPEFKKCTMCGKVWHSFEELESDPDKKLVGVMLDTTNHLYNLILFNCSCSTTLAMLVKEFIPHTDIEFVINEHRDSPEKPTYCLKEEGDPCLDMCTCQYTGKILEALK